MTGCFFFFAVLLDLKEFLLLEYMPIGYLSNFKALSLQPTLHWSHPSALPRESQPNLQTVGWQHHPFFPTGPPCSRMV